MKGFSSRRLVLLASAAGLAIAAVAAGPSGFKSNLPAFTTPARADSVQPSAGFADVVAKVKPAVISVRVKIDETARTTGCRKACHRPGRAAVK
jgi:serine protease Do